MRLVRPIKLIAGATIDPVLWCDHGNWQVVQDETCLFPAWKTVPGRRARFLRGRTGYWICRLWCWRHGYGWLPVNV